jgi:hypothetical protein
MPIPFTHKYSQSLGQQLSVAQQQRAFAFIAFYLKDKTVEEIIRSEKGLTFKSGAFKFRLNIHILNTIEKGSFEFYSRDNLSVLGYEIYMYRLFTQIGILGALAYIASKEAAVPLLALAILGLNWVIAIVRHRLMLLNIIEGLKILIDTETHSAQEEEDLFQRIIYQESLNA